MTSTILPIFLVLALFSSGLILFGSIRIIRSQIAISERIKTYTFRAAEKSFLLSANQPNWINKLRFRVNTLLSSVSSTDLQQKLYVVNWPISASELNIITVFGTAIGLIVGWLISGQFISGLGLALLIALMPSIMRKRVRYLR